MINNKLGLASEINFELKALEKNLLISRPVDPTSAYDVLVDNGERIFRVQIKSSQTIHPTKNKYRIFISKRKKKYTSKEVDIFAIYIQPLDIWYIIPFEFVEKISVIDFYPNTVSKFNKYKEKWNFLLQ